MILGQLLIFALLISVELRVFFIKQAKKDSYVFVAPITLFLAILNIFSWGLNIVNIIALTLSFIVVLINIYSIFKMVAKLLTDSYSIFTKVIAIIISIICLGAIIFTLLFSPITTRSAKLGIYETKENYEGNFRSGFTPIKAGSSASATFYQYSNIDYIPQAKQNVVVLITDKRGDAVSYVPFMQYLAKENFTVCTMDFFTDDLVWLDSKKNSKALRRFMLVSESLSENSKLDDLQETFTYNYLTECDAIISLLTERYGSQCKYFLIGDGMSSPAVISYAEQHPEKITGTFCLDSISEYKTAGYGCVEETDPLVASYLGQKRDKHGFITKYLVLKSKEEIRKAWGLKPKANKGKKNDAE